MRKTLLFTVLTLLFLIPKMVQTLQAAETTEALYSVEFMAPGSENIPEAARDAIVLSLNYWTEEPPENRTFSLIGLRWEESWGLATLTSADLDAPLPEGEHTNVGFGNMITLLVVETDEGWQAAIEDDPLISELLQFVPTDDLGNQARVALFPEIMQDQQSLGVVEATQASTYKFPWRSGTPWRVTQGWHSVSTFGGRFQTYHAIDFDISGGHTNGDIVAATSGTITYVCQGYNNQYLVAVSSDGSGELFGYLHIDGATFNAEGLHQGAHVNMGDKLGRMREGWIEDNCGYSQGTHIHLIFPNKPFTIDGKTFTSSNYHSGVDLYSSQTSDKTPPTISFSAPAQNIWFGSDATLSWTVNDGDSGVAYYKWSWDDSTPDNVVNSATGSTTLSAAGQGPHTLYVQAFDNAGNASTVYQRGWFGYDTLAPTNPISISTDCGVEDRTWQNVCAAPHFDWSAGEDNGSGVKEYQLYWGEDPSGVPNISTTETMYSAPAVPDTGIYYLRLSTQDHVGNISEPTTLFTLFYDITPPLVTVAINEGSSTTAQVGVDVHVDASDGESGLAQIRMSNDGVTWTDWQHHTEVNPWSIPAINRQEHTVYVEVKDHAGNHIQVTDEILLNVQTVYPDSPNYQLCATVANEGVREIGNENYQLTLSIGDTTTKSNSTNYQLSSGFVGAIDGCDTQPSTQDTLNIATETGWQLISLPFLTEQTLIDTALAPITSCYDLVYAYDSESGQWLRYAPDGPPFGNTLSTVTATTGLWLRGTDSCTLDMSGEFPAAVSLDLDVGWNLVSIPVNEATPVTDVIAPVVAQVEIVYWYEPATGQWVRHAPDGPPFGNTLSQIEPGKAYWIQVNKAVTLPLQN